MRRALIASIELATPFIEKVLFQKVVLPGALPFIITGFRQAFARAWIAVVGGEMIAATSWGLGWVIFDGQGIPQHRCYAGQPRRHRGCGTRLRASHL